MVHAFSPTLETTALWTPRRQSQGAGFRHKAPREVGGLWTGPDTRWQHHLVGQTEFPAVQGVIHIPLALHFKDRRDTLH